MISAGNSQSPSHPVVFPLPSFSQRAGFVHSNRVVGDFEPTIHILDYLLQ